MAKSFGQAAGLFFGCLIGMAPLLWLDPLKAERTRLQSDRLLNKAAHTFGIECGLR